MQKGILNEIFRKYLLPALLILLVIVLVVRAVVQERFEDLRNTLTLQIADQERLLSTIAEITARNGADSVTEGIVKDCSVNERTEFDNLLGKLDQGLSLVDLNKLERLFGRCGSFFAQRKSVMVSRLAREIDIYDMQVSQLRSITNEKATEKYQVSTWQSLATKEQAQSELFSQLVAEQDVIIKYLLSGKRAADTDFAATLTRVRETNESLAVANAEAAALRSTLNKI
jgi:hypothetical protein